jgi:hypothetical protein
MFWWVSGGYLVPHPKKSKFLSPLVKEINNGCFSIKKTGRLIS